MALFHLYLSESLKPERGGDMEDPALLPFKSVAQQEPMQRGLDT